MEGRAYCVKTTFPSPNQDTKMTKPYCLSSRGGQTPTQTTTKQSRMREVLNKAREVQKGVRVNQMQFFQGQC